MNSAEIRKKFLEFFQSKEHLIMPSAPIVIKDDPTLMFTNAGMNQFKEFFLGHGTPKSKRIADTQKCLRVSGKHNDLEEVGVDTYHHTMFEMLGNWSFGDYFKKEAIAWAWELLTEVYKIDKDRLYVTVFEGDKAENLQFDEDAHKYWLTYVPKEKIVTGKKKDNFWEMGETGPCGPCSEVHVDVRSDEERKKVNGRSLVNTGHPQVIEIWNLVFMEFNRKADSSLEKLPAQHVDTGMGFERLCMVLQGKKSNYDTDVFTPLINEIEKLSGKRYNLEPSSDFVANVIAQGGQEKVRIAMRVIADHIRAITFTIADGLIPSNDKAGYVSRRILRRAVTYGYQSLGFKEPFLYKLVNRLVVEMGDIFPEIKHQQFFIETVIKEEELAFMRTLAQGLWRLQTLCGVVINNRETMLKGEQVFELHDTYGFPSDLTALIAKENNISIDEKGFQAALEKQRERSRKDAVVNKDDWSKLNSWQLLEKLQKDNESKNKQLVSELEKLEQDKTQKQEKSKRAEWLSMSETVKMGIGGQFTGYYKLIEDEAYVSGCRRIKAKGKDYYQIVLDSTPFYAESGGQVGDIGFFETNGKRISVIDTQKENNLILHIIEELPNEWSKAFSDIAESKNPLDTWMNGAGAALKVKAIVNQERRTLTADNHSATHLLHAALRKVLGKHVEQRGSMVHPDYLRFDFSHFSKITDEELKEIETIVNKKIRENIACETKVMPIEEAKKLGAMALFGEKYGDTVRVVTMDKNYSIELCGGTHVKATGQIGYFKILSESAVSAGIRRIEAVTALKAEEYISEQLDTVRQAAEILKSPKNILKGIHDLQAQAAELSKQVEKLGREQGQRIKADLIDRKQQITDVSVIWEKIEVLSADVAKDICFQLKSEVPNLFLILGAEINGKANLFLALSDSLVKEKNWNASILIREFSKEIKGGGGGQPFYATAGGTNIQGIEVALAQAKTWVEQNK